MKNYMCAIIIVDDKQKYWVDDYEDLSPHAKTIRYEFKNKQQLLKDFYDIPYDEGYWCFLINKNNETLISGCFDWDIEEYIDEL